MSISERVELLRTQRGVSLTYLNNAIGAYRGKLTEVRNGKSTLSSTEISRLAQALMTSTDYLLGNTDDPSPTGGGEAPRQESKDGIEAAKIALFGGDGEVTDEMWEEAVFAAQMIKERYRRKKATGD